MPLMYCKRQGPVKWHKVREIKHAVTGCKSSDLYNTVILRDFSQGVKPLPLISPCDLNNSVSVVLYRITRQNQYQVFHHCSERRLIDSKFYPFLTIYPTQTLTMPSLSMAVNRSYKSEICYCWTSPHIYLPPCTLVCKIRQSAEKHRLFDTGL